ncbi:hypothetical protein AB833_03615 [Chromatiales bacterium (ex Bugula neritina AB1)]|nr:hypothetical protein AB833_03615 [Chromatiales bacterium (ex Bugula neritina AB1)]
MVLLEQVGRGDTAAFRALYNQTSGQLFAVLLRILKQESLAEDALQESFMRVWNSASRYSEELGRPLTWMTSIARYHALDVLRANNASARRDSHYAAETDRLQELNQRSILLELEHTDVLSRCLDRIDEDARNCVIRAYCEGYTHEELSNLNGTPLGTVKSWIRRALLSLRGCIDELS